MKKLLTVLLTLVMAIGLVVLNNNHTKADESNPTIDNYLCFTAEEAGSTVWFENKGSNNPNVEVSTDGGKTFNTWSGGDVNKKTLADVGDKIYVRGSNVGGFSFSASNYTKFGMTGKIAVSGNVMGLIDNGAGTTMAIPNNRCFELLFDGCASIISISDKLLPATTLNSWCYENMFQNCTGLTTLPENLLPALNLSGCYSCYVAMFYGCSNLVSIPNLPATTLEQGCYISMFQACPKIALATSDTGFKQFYINADQGGGGYTDYMFSSGVTSPSSKTTYYIDSKDLHYSTTNTITEQEYTGSEIRPKVSLTHGNLTYYASQPVEGTDYTVEYTDNINPGTATITIKAKGATYTGSKTIHFNIVKSTPSPSKKDESCEKVIGPTWHWNNTKGICEDYGVVGTYTR